MSELNNGKKFYYSNHTNTQPKDASQLVSIAGCGSSPIIRYEGTGAYFMDCLEPGVWRLEVMPDAVVVLSLIHILHDKGVENGKA